MINGSSAIHNIHTATVIEPHIRATLKYNSFIGNGWDADINNYYTGEDAKTTVFNNRYVYYSNTESLASAVTFDAGGSALSNIGVSSGYINGVSWNDQTILRGGDFRNTGSTLDLYFLRVGTTDGSVYITNLYKMSTPNGTSWTGATLLNSIASVAYDYDVAIGSSKDVYTMGYDLDHDVIRYGTETSGRSVMYTDPYKTGVYYDNALAVVRKRINLLEFTDKRWLVIDSGPQFTVQTSESIYNPPYWPNIKLMRIGLTSVFDTRIIATASYGEDGLKIVYGRVGGASNNYAYFGINRYNRELVPFINDLGNYNELQTVDTTNVLCKMDSDGRIFQRSVSVNDSTFTSLCVGGVSSYHDLTLISQAGEFSLLFYPFYETYGSSTDLSSNIIGYTNSDNKRVSLDIGNIK